MITTKYNFKQWLHRQYPDITATPIYGIPAYILSKPLENADMFLYNVQTLKDGRYVVFIGTDLVTAQHMLTRLNEGKTPITREQSNIAPTTFSSFEAWLNRNHIIPLNRTFCNHMSASQALMTNDIKNCIDIDAIKTWYLYELPLIDESQLSKVPHITIQNKSGKDISCVLIKACNSSYKSKRTLFMEKFSLMQPLYEQLISLAARAGAQDEIQPGTGEWDQVKLICEQYMGIQFECEGSVDMEALKEAANNGTLGIWTRNRSNFQSDDEADF